MEVAAQKYFKIESRRKSKIHRRHRDVLRRVFQKGRNVAVSLPPEVEDKFSLVAGLDLAQFEIDGSRVMLTFSRPAGLGESL